MRFSTSSSRTRSRRPSRTTAARRRTRSAPWASSASTRRTRGRRPSRAVRSRRRRRRRRRPARDWISRPPRDFLVFRCSRNDALPPPNGGRAPSPTPPSRSSPPAAFKFSAGIISTETGETCSPSLVPERRRGRRRRRRRRRRRVPMERRASSFSSFVFSSSARRRRPRTSAARPRRRRRKRGPRFGGVAVALASATTPPLAEAQRREPLDVPSPDRTSSVARRGQCDAARRTKADDPKFE